MAKIRWRPADVAMAALLLATAVGLGWAWLDRPLVGNDIEWQYLPGHAWLGRAVAGGELPLWCSEAGAGFPLVAEGQIGPFYPGNLLRVTSLPPWRAYGLTMLLHLALAGLGVYVHLRLLGARRLAALIAGMTFMGSGPILARAVHLNLFEGLCWLPWLGVGLELALRGRRALVGGVAVGMMLLAGHQHPLLLSTLFAPLYLIGRRLVGDVDASWRDLPKRVLTPFLLGALLGAAAWLPLAELVPQGERAAGLTLESRTVLSLEPAGLYALIAPQWFGSPHAVDQSPMRRFGVVLPYEWCPYVGLVPLLALCWLGGLGRRWRWLFGLMALGGLLLAMGRVLPFYPALSYLPGWSMVRGPGRLLPLFAYGLALLLGLTLSEHTLRGGPVGRPRLYALLATLFAALLLAGIAWLLATAPSRNGEPWWRAGSVVGCATLLLALRVKAGRGRLWLSALALVVAADLISAFSGYYALGETDYYDPPVGVAAMGDAPVRLMAPDYHGVLGSNRHLLYPGIANVGLRSVLATARTMHLGALLEKGRRDGDSAGRTWLSLLRVTATQSLQTPERSVPRLRLKPTGVPPAPDAWLVPRVERAASAQASLERVSRPDWRPDAVALVEGRAPAVAASTLGTIGVVRHLSRQRLAVATDCQEAQMLVVGQSAYPGWRCYQQGRSSAVRVVDHALAGAVVAPGRGWVRLVFEPTTQRLGLFLSLLGLALVVAMWIGGRHE
ncbi:MAG: hypothetical protein HZB16_15605 [Armatimonadetes bacterium]|nr:hypothetical protein [Armatimonadota bacterium]